MRHRPAGTKAVTGMFQSTRPMWGETPGNLRYYSKQKYFNPLTPCGVRRLPHRPTPWSTGISIHSPRTGWDRSRVFGSRSGTDFNPLIPCRIRREHEPFGTIPVYISIPSSNTGQDLHNKHSAITCKATVNRLSPLLHTQSNTAYLQYRSFIITDPRLHTEHPEQV